MEHALRLVESVPDVGLIREGYAYPVVVDRDADGPVRRRLHSHLYRPVRARELKGIAHVVRDDLLDARGIREDRQGDASTTNRM